jgi:phospholipid/cholesterol/gamma-HCH transport system substrate-binding protein
MSSSRKITVGLFLAGGVLLFTIGLFWIGDRRLLFERSLELNAEYRKVSGLTVGSKVQVSGMDAGEVLTISVPGGPEGRFRVRFRVLEKFLPVLRSDSVATIEMDGLVGNEVLQVSAGSAQGRRVRSGDTIQSREPLEIADMIKQAVDTAEYARGAVDDVKRGVDSAVENLTSLNRAAIQLVSDVGEDVERITTTGSKIAQDVGEVIEGVKAGRGTVGKLVTEDRLYNRMRSTLREAEQTMQNIRESSENMKQVSADLKATKVPENLDRTMANIREMSDKGKEAMAALLPSGAGESGMAASLRETLDHANEAMADVAENTEALKRNWFFRGFYNSRGFFDLDAVSVADYKAGKFAPRRARRREWLQHHELFTTKDDGTEVLSEEGKKKVGAVMAAFLQFAANNPIMIEGYASAGSPEEQFLRSRERAAMLRAYLISRFHLRPGYIGIVPMGAVESADPSGRAWDGAALVLFLAEDSARGVK